MSKKKARNQGIRAMRYYRRKYNLNTHFMSYFPGKYLVASNGKFPKDLSMNEVVKLAELYKQALDSAPFRKALLRFAREFAQELKRKKLKTAPEGGHPFPKPDHLDP